MKLRRIVAQNLRRLRQDRDLTQEERADLAQLNRTMGTDAASQLPLFNGPLHGRQDVGCALEDIRIEERPAP
jgi:hypothetical protein